MQDTWLSGKLQQCYSKALRFYFKLDQCGWWTQISRFSKDSLIFMISFPLSRSIATMSNNTMHDVNKVNSEFTRLLSFFFFLVKQIYLAEFTPNNYLKKIVNLFSLVAFPLSPYSCRESRQFTLLKSIVSHVKCKSNSDELPVSTSLPPFLYYPYLKLT